MNTPGRERGLAAKPAGPVRPWLLAVELAGPRGVAVALAGAAGRGVWGGGFGGGGVGFFPGLGAFLGGGGGGGVGGGGGGVL